VQVTRVKPVFCNTVCCIFHVTINTLETSLQGYILLLLLNHTFHLHKGFDVKLELEVSMKKMRFLSIDITGLISSPGGKCVISVTPVAWSLSYERKMLTEFPQICFLAAFFIMCIYESLVFSVMLCIVVSYLISVSFSKTMSVVVMWLFIVECVSYCTSGLSNLFGGAGHTARYHSFRGRIVFRDDKMH